MNAKETAQKAITAADVCLRKKGHISMVDVLMETGKLSREDYERWRFRQIPYLEKVIQGSLAQLDLVVRAVRNNSLNGGLKPSHAAYVSWGKGRRQPLRFTKTGNPFFEQAYSTHYLSPRERSKPSLPSAAQSQDERKLGLL